jgi:2-polyprenyl-6-methoxyphenol hydroxylase-like FAD-dependent oxidoreductase
MDVVVLGGGIAGGALATELATAGASVIVLERSTEYRDRVRGENMQPWGVAEAQRLGVLDVLLDAGGNVGLSVVDVRLAERAERLRLVGFDDPVRSFPADGEPEGDGDD